ncbi:hypothetical protein OAX78_04235, partial [Planctomycetota bacterium]|nr:hypothetical protein [Planctomycetota bacterium]
MPQPVSSFLRHTFFGIACLSAAAITFSGCSGGGSGGGGFASTAAPVASGTNPGGTANSQLTALGISPPIDTVQVDLSLGSEFQLIVDGYYHDSAVRDLTRDVTFEIADDQVAQVTGEGLVQPVAAGSTELRVSQTSITGEVLTITRTIEVLPASAAVAQPNFVDLVVYPPFRTLGAVDTSTGVEQLQQVTVVALDDTGRWHDVTRTIGYTVQDLQRNPVTSGSITPTGLFRAVESGRDAVVAVGMPNYALVAGAHFVMGNGQAAPL